MLLRSLVEFGFVVKEDAQDGDGHADGVGEGDGVAEEHDGNRDHEDPLRGIRHLREGRGKERWFRVMAMW